MSAVSFEARFCLLLRFPPTNAQILAGGGNSHLNLMHSDEFNLPRQTRARGSQAGRRRRRQTHNLTAGHIAFRSISRPLAYGGGALLRAQRNARAPPPIGITANSRVVNKPLSGSIILDICFNPRRSYLDHCYCIPDKGNSFTSPRLSRPLIACRQPRTPIEGPSCRASGP